MNEDGVLDICDALSLRSGPAYTGGDRWGPHMSISCFPPGTPVLTDTGYVPIEHVAVGQKVLTKVTGYQPVVGKHYREFSGQMITLKTKGLSHFPLTGTDNHRVPCISKEEVRKAKASAAYLARRDGITDTSRYEFTSSARLTELQDIKIGDFIRLPDVLESEATTVTIDISKHQTIYKMPNGGERISPAVIPLKLNLNRQLASLLGLWLAEGCVGGAKGKADVCFANFTFARGEDLIEDCIALSKQVLGLEPTLYEYDCKDTCSDVRIHNWLTARWFREIMGSGAENKRIPDFIMTAPLDVVKAFVRAYWRGAGSQYNSAKVNLREISTLSPTIANQLPILLGRLRLACRVTTRKARVDKDGVNHRKSYAIIWARSQENCAGKRINGGMWYPVKEISHREAIREPVYNLAVDIDETYTVGPWAVKNCPLACLNHGDAYDWNTSCSISISEDEPSMAKCFSFNCGYSGSFYTMLKQAIKARGEPERLVALLKKIEPTEKLTLESSIARSKKRFDALVAQARQPVLGVRDRDILPEARLQRFRRCVPKYAINRGLTLETCNAWELGYDEKNKRLVFPVRRHDSKLIGLTGRVLDSELIKAEAAGRPMSKYHNYAGLDKARYIFGEHMLKHGEPIVIVEGQIDAILVWQYLGLSAVAPLGEGFSRNHVRTICSFEPPVVYLFPDNDAAGKLAAEKFEYGLHGRVPLRLMMPPELMDPGAMNKLEMETAKAESKPIMGKITWSTP